MKIFALIVFVLLLAGCSGPDHVSAAEFKKEYAWVGQPQSMRQISFLGVRDGKAFLKVSTMGLIGSEWKNRVIYVEVGELDDAFRRALPPEPIKSPQTTTGSSAPDRV